jgi:hypothetical protein
MSARRFLNAWTVDLTLVLLVSGAIRTVLFSGFIGGDDWAYADLVHRVIEDGYPAVENNVFASRPVLVGLLAASIRTLGWTESAFALPFFLASLVGIGAAYALGRLLFDRITGFFAAFTLCLLPLDAVYATTATNDILASACVATGAVIALTAFRRLDVGQTTVAARGGAIGGAVVALASGIKFSAIIVGLPLVLVAAPVALARPDARRFAAALISGWAGGHVLLAAFFALTSHDPFAPYRVEFGFNQAFMLDGYLKNRWNALLMYPRVALALQYSGPIATRFFPYGVFFPVLFVAAGLSLKWSPSRVWFLVVWCFGLIAVLEFWPLQLSPYVPIHRLPRFMHTAVVPGAVIIGCVLREALRRGSFGVVAAVGTMALYAVTGLQASLIASAYHQDCMQDMRRAAMLADAHDGPVVTDSELRGYLMFRQGFSHLEKLHTVLGGQTIIPIGALVIFGGTRRVDMDPAWIADRVPARLPITWVKVADLPGDLSSWRRWRGAAYLSTTKATKVLARGVSDLIGASSCPSDQRWQLVDVLDVGDRGSEEAHAYVIDGQTFSGERSMWTDRNLEFTDDGRAFRAAQSFNASMEAGVEACVVKRIDPSVQRQVSRWTVEGELIGDLEARVGDTFGRWPSVSVTIPGHLVRRRTVRLREAFVASDIDINAFRIEVYQRAGSRSSADDASVAR